MVDLATPTVTSLRRPDRLVDRASSATAVLGMASVVLWVVAVRSADFSAMGHLGLVSILGPAYFLGLTACIVAFSIELLRRRLRTGWLLGLVVVLVVYLFGTASAIEPVAALTSSWVHAGYVNYISLHGHSLDNFAAEFSWPGGFSLGSVLVAFAGQHDAVTLLRWFPLVIELLYLAPMLVIARCSGVSRRAGWLGIAVFYAANWIYQDYFSPQALDYLFFLVVVACVLACWRPRPLAAAHGTHGVLLRRLDDTRAGWTFARLRGDDAVTDWRSDRVLAVLGLLAVIALAMAVSHQLTPYALVFALLACLVTRRLGRPELIAVIVLFAVGWLSLGASNYWANHLGAIFGQFGAIGSIVGQNVGNRITGSASHRFIVDARILLTAAVFGLAGIGVLRRAADSRTLEGLAAVPFGVLAFQSYGGEGLLRVVLFSLPFASLLVASAILPARFGELRPWLPRFSLGRHGRVVLAVAAAGMLLVLSIATTVVRGGNDAFESYSLGELKAVNYAYSHAFIGTKLAFISPYAPFGQTGVDVFPGGITLVGVAGNLSAPSQHQMLQTFINIRPSWIILSHAQEEWGEVVAGYPAGWQAELKKVLLTKGYTVVLNAGTAIVLHTTQGGT